MARSQRGFTLVEMMAALGLLTLSLVALTTLPIMSVQANAQAEHVTAATNLVQDKLEDIQGTDYAAVTSGSDSSPLAADGQPGNRAAIYTRSWAVSAGPTAGTKQVTVTVQWTDVTSKQISLQTLINE